MSPRLPCQYASGGCRFAERIVDVLGGWQGVIVVIASSSVSEYDDSLLLRQDKVVEFYDHVYLLCCVMWVYI